MNFESAKVLARLGVKVTHKYFTPEEWMIMDENIIIFEDGASIDADEWAADEWARDKDFLDDGWSKWEEPEADTRPIVKDFNAFDHGTGPIKIGHKVHFMRPMEIHLKHDGAKDEGPSLAIIMTDFMNVPVMGEITVAMFNEGLADIGYELVKK